MSSGNTGSNTQKFSYRFSRRYLLICRNLFKQNWHGDNIAMHQSPVIVAVVSVRADIIKVWLLYLLYLWSFCGQPFFDVENIALLWSRSQQNFFCSQTLCDGASLWAIVSCKKIVLFWLSSMVKITVKACYYFAIMKVKVTVKACIIKIWSCLLYLQNCWSICNLTWWWFRALFSVC